MLGQSVVCMMNALLVGACKMHAWSVGTCMMDAWSVGVLQNGSLVNEL